MLFVLAALVSAQASSTPLEPTEPWTLSSQDDGCTIASAPNRDAIQIGFQTFMQSRPAYLLVRGSNKMLPSGNGDIALTLDGGQPVMVHYGSFETNESGVRLTKVFPDDSTMTRLAAATTIVIGTKMPPLHIVGAGAAIQAVDRCTGEKLSAWGVDPALYFQGRTAKITGYFAAMFDWHNYPKEAQGTGAAGRVVLLLKTDKDGAIAECKVVASPDPRLDRGTCDVAKRGRLKPPMDAAGQPIASFAVIPVRWISP